MTIKNKLQILWERWYLCFDYWWVLQYPHLHYSGWEYNKIYELEDAFWFWFALNGNEWYLEEPDDKRTN